MAMDKVFQFDQQEFISDVVDFKVFLEEATSARKVMRHTLARFQEGASSRDSAIRWYPVERPLTDEEFCAVGGVLNTIKRELRHPTKQYNFEKDDGRGRMALPKKAQLSCINRLLKENEKRRNPQYKSIALRSMQYDRFDTSVICHSVRAKRWKSIDSETLCEAEDAIRDKLEDVTEATTDVETVSSASTLKSLQPASQRSTRPRSNSIPFYNPYEDSAPVPVVEILSDIKQDGSDDKCAFASADESTHFGPAVLFTDFSSTNYSTTVKENNSNVGSANMWQDSSAWTNDHLTFANSYQSTCGAPPFFSTFSSSEFTDIKHDPTSFSGRSGGVDFNTYTGDEVSASISHGSERIQVVPKQEVEDYDCAINDSLYTSFPVDMAADELDVGGEHLNDIVAQVSIHVGYPRALEKHEVRLGRLLKILDRFLVLGSNTLKDLKNAIDCPSDYHIFEDVSERAVTENDLCKNRYPSSYFFFHDMFYVDFEPKGSQDITKEVRSWLQERHSVATNVAAMDTTRILDLKCRLGAPYLYVHAGTCEHLISFNTLTLRDDCHPRGTYPVPIFERNSRRTVCCGCTEVTAEWVVWEHECTPAAVQYFCDSCYRDFNFDTSGKKIFHFKAAPLYTRHSHRNEIPGCSKVAVDTEEEEDD